MEVENNARTLCRKLTNVEHFETDGEGEVRIVIVAVM
jgi:hypothetical protein